jgi:hypothetical protein
MRSALNNTSSRFAISDCVSGTRSHTTQTQKVCGPAQARLLLRFGLRGKRDAIATLKLERRACKVRGDNDGLAAVRSKQRRAGISMRSHVKMLAEGISASTVVKAARKWSEKKRTLNNILKNRASDKKTEFCVNCNSLIDLAALKEENDEDMTEADDEDDDEEMSGIKLEEQDTETLPDVKSEEDDLVDHSSAPASIWSRHALQMQTTTAMSTSQTTSSKPNSRSKSSISTSTSTANTNSAPQPQTRTRNPHRLARAQKQHATPFWPRPRSPNTACGSSRPLLSGVTSKAATTGYARLSPQRHHAHPKHLRLDTHLFRLRIPDIQHEAH